MRMLVLAVSVFLATGAIAETFNVPTTVDGKKIKYVVLHFGSPISGKRTVVIVAGGKIQIPEGFDKFRGYCLADASKKALKCLSR